MESDAIVSPVHVTLMPLPLLKTCEERLGARQAVSSIRKPASFRFLDLPADERLSGLAREFLFGDPDDPARLQVGDFHE